MMEAKSLSKAEHLSSDIITKLPQPIIEIILCLLPIEEAARTSILSRDWRYKWTTIPKLVFNDSCIESNGTHTETQTSDLASARKNMDEWCKLLYAIHQVLLLHQGPIHEFTLSMDANDHYFEIDQIILHLSRNHPLKKLTIEFDGINCYKLPICVFSLHHLTDLDLSNVILDRQPIFNGYRNLRSLRLYYVCISTKALVHMLSNCPSLTSFTLYTYGLISYKDRRIIIELFECLPLIEHLDIRLGTLLEMFVLGPVSKELPTSLTHLKCVCVRDMWLVDDALHFVLFLIKCSPNLGIIRLLQLDFEWCYKNTTFSGILEEYSDVRLEHLSELEIETSSDFRHQIEFVKFILVRSPKLKKVRILFIDNTFRQKSDILKDIVEVLSQTPRASPLEIVVSLFGRPDEDQTFRSPEN